MPKPTLQSAANENYGRLYRSALFMCGDPWMAEDIVQETFLAARKAWDNFRGDSSPYTWLYRIMLNVFRRKLRRDRKMLSLSDIGDQTDNESAGGEELVESEAPLPQEAIESTERAAIVRAAIDTLPAHHREVLVLRFLEEKTYEQIAETLECSIGTVKSRLHYALKKVGETFKAAGVRPGEAISRPGGGLDGRSL